MNIIGLIAVLLFAVGWAGGVAAWFYGTYHLVRKTFGADDPAHTRKMMKAFAAFIACWLFTFSNGLIGVFLGGWPNTASH
jgi:hypothetical protein